jgi:transcriptional regulator with XRE-family HTH domain
MSSSLHNDSYLIFRNLLIKARVASGLTQVQIAERLGKPQSYISKYEHGERRLDFPEFLVLADIMKIDVAGFIDEYCSGLTLTAIEKAQRSNK